MTRATLRAHLARYLMLALVVVTLAGTSPLVGDGCQTTATTGCTGN